MTRTRNPFLRTELIHRFASLRSACRFPLSIIQLEAFWCRAGVFQCWVLKYQSFELAVKLFEDEYKSRYSRRPWRRGCDVQRADVFDASVSRLGTRLQPCLCWNDYGDPVVCLSQCLAGSSALGIDPDLPADSGAGALSIDHLIKRDLRSVL